MLRCKKHPKGQTADDKGRTDFCLTCMVARAENDYNAKNTAAQYLGRIKSAKKAKSSRENGKKGGRPKKADARKGPDCGSDPS